MREARRPMPLDVRLATASSSSPPSLAFLAPSPSLAVPLASFSAPSAPLASATLAAFAALASAADGRLRFLAGDVDLATAAFPALLLSALPDGSSSSVSVTLLRFVAPQLLLLRVRLFFAKAFAAALLLADAFELDFFGCDALLVRESPRVFAPPSVSAAVLPSWSSPLMAESGKFALSTLRAAALPRRAVAAVGFFGGGRAVSMSSSLPLPGGSGFSKCPSSARASARAPLRTFLMRPAMNRAAMACCPAPSMAASGNHCVSVFGLPRGCTRNCGEPPPL
mmetsp:Transcript_5909/g.16512  ORF Transcript_5909/g.16512 Transcript_5909/m.16512 type:complete len:281 (-) Transcript_5909:1368-2210(-)